MLARNDNSDIVKLDKNSEMSVVYTDANTGGAPNNADPLDCIGGALKLQPQMGEDGSTIDSAGRIYVTTNPGVQVIGPDGKWRVTSSAWLSAVRAKGRCMALPCTEAGSRTCSAARSLRSG